MSGTMEHRVAYSMYEQRLRGYEDRKCPRAYCAHEFKAIESHPQT